MYIDGIFYQYNKTYTVHLVLDLKQGTLHIPKIYNETIDNELVILKEQYSTTIAFSIKGFKHPYGILEELKSYIETDTDILINSMSNNLLKREWSRLFINTLEI